MFRKYNNDFHLSKLCLCCQILLSKSSPKQIFTKQLETNVSNLYNCFLHTQPVQVINQSTLKYPYPYQSATYFVLERLEWNFCINDGSLSYESLARMAGVAWVWWLNSSTFTNFRADNLIISCQSCENRNIKTKSGCKLNYHWL